MQAQKSSFKNDTTQNNIKILIVDDDQISISILHHFLEDFGFKNIHLALTAKEAIELSSKNFDFIIVDINLTDMKGIDLTRYLRKFYNKKHMPIICYSSTSEKYHRECIEAGMDDFLPKPFTPDNLREILECWLPMIKLKAT